eukprot:gene3186-3464_t
MVPVYVQQELAGLGVDELNTIMGSGQLTAGGSQRAGCAAAGDGECAVTLGIPKDVPSRDGSTYQAEATTAGLTTERWASIPARASNKEQRQAQSVAAAAARLMIVQHPDGSFALLSCPNRQAATMTAAAALAAAAVLPATEWTDLSDLDMQRCLAAADAPPDEATAAGDASITGGCDDGGSGFAERLRQLDAAYAAALQTRLAGQQ